MGNQRYDSSKYTRGSVALAEKNSKTETLSIKDRNNLSKGNLLIIEDETGQVQLIENVSRKALITQRAKIRHPKFSGKILWDGSKKARKSMKLIMDEKSGELTFLEGEKAQKYKTTRNKSILVDYCSSYSCTVIVFQTLSGEIFILRGKKADETIARHKKKNREKDGQILWPKNLYNKKRPKGRIWVIKTPKDVVAVFSKEEMESMIFETEMPTTHQIKKGYEVIFYS